MQIVSSSTTETDSNDADFEASEAKAYACDTSNIYLERQIFDSEVVVTENGVTPININGSVIEVCDFVVENEDFDEKTDVLNQFYHMYVFVGHR